MAGVNDFEVGKRYLIDTQESKHIRIYEVEVIEQSSNKKYIKLHFITGNIIPGYDKDWHDCNKIEYIEELPTVE